MDLEKTNVGGIQGPDRTSSSRARRLPGEKASRSVLGSQLVLLRMLPLHPELGGGGWGGEVQAGDQALPLGAHFKSQFLSCHVWVMTSLCLRASLSLRPKGGGAALRCHCSPSPCPSPCSSGLRTNRLLCGPCTGGARTHRRSPDSCFVCVHRTLLRRPQCPEVAAPTTASIRRSCARCRRPEGLLTCGVGDSQAGGTQLLVHAIL